VSPPRLAFALLSFAVMAGATGWVLRDSWPAGGMPWLPWTVHAAAGGTALVEVLARAFKIMASARACGVPLRFRTALTTSLAGDFAAAITPARAGAEPARYLVLAEAGIAPAARVLVLFLELFLEMWSLVLVCGALAWAFAGAGSSARGLAALVGGYSGVVLGVGAVGVGLARRHARGPAPAWVRRAGGHAGHWRGVQRLMRGARTGVAALRHARPGVMALALGGSVVHVLGKVAALPVLVVAAGAATGVAVPLTREALAPLVLWPLALFYGGVVVPAPGGGGFIEGAFAATLRDAIPPTLFAASLLWWRFYTFYLYLLVGAVAAGRGVLRALRS
jgi:uncharacterized membrane protein YbhN (UPF0104 family)